MSVLIIGPARVGATSLATNLSEMLNILLVNEPYNYRNKPKKLWTEYPLNISENIVCKMGVLQLPFNYKKGYFSFIAEFQQTFEHTIFLTRTNKKEHLESRINLGIQISTPGKNAHSPWYIDDIKDREDFYTYDKNLRQDIETINKLSIDFNIPLVAYEDLYGANRIKSLNIIESWGLGIDSNELNNRLHPRYKYRQTGIRPRI